MSATTSNDPWDYVPEQLRIRYDEELVSIPNAVRVAGQRYRDREALVDGDLRLTFADLESQMLASVRAMMALGVEPGQRVAVWAPNSARWVIAALGILGAGGILVPINTRFKGDEAAYVLRKSGATALVAVTDFLDSPYLEMVRAADSDLEATGPGRVVVASGPAGEGELSWEAFLAAGEAVSEADAQGRIDAIGVDTISDIMFTSGTTGQPKGVVLTHGQSLRAHGWLTKVMDFTEGDRYLIIPPFFHTFGYKAGWMACIVHGVTILPFPVFTVDGVMDTIEREKVTIMLGPPTLFQGVLNSPRWGEVDLSSLRVAMASAASVPPSLVRAFKEDFQVEVTLSAYGLTEATSLCTTTYPGIDDFEDVTTSVGRVAWDIEARVVDEAGNEVDQGQPGELLVRGYNVMQGYWDDPEQTAEVITPDGWLRTGDIVVVNERGFITITDRKKDIVIVGGFNVYPAEVERILGEHPAVESVAVIGSPDERMGEVAVAFVVRRPDTTLSSEELIAWAGEHMANFKVPRQVIMVDDLPRNASMKVLKNELRAQL